MSTYTVHSFYKLASRVLIGYIALIVSLQTKIQTFQIKVVEQFTQQVSRDSRAKFKKLMVELPQRCQI